MKIYPTPFEYDPYSQMITCPGIPHIVAQVDEHSLEVHPDNVALVRGWGGLHTTFGVNKGAEIQNAMGRRIAELLNEHGIGQELQQLIG